MILVAAIAGDFFSARFHTSTQLFVQTSLYIYTQISLCPLECVVCASVRCVACVCVCARKLRHMDQLSKLAH